MHGCQFVGTKQNWAAEWMSFLNNEVAHLIPPLVGTETIKPVARGRVTVLKVTQVVLYTDYTFQLPPTLTISRRGSACPRADDAVLDMRYVALRQ